MQVDWGSHDLVVAARHLLAAALANPSNQRFVLLSESGIPLYPPAAMHLQLLSEDLSRARALLPCVIYTLLSFLFRVKPEAWLIMRRSTPVEQGCGP